MTERKGKKDMGIDDALDKSTAMICDCPDYTVSNPQIEAAQIMAWTHGMEYTGAVMRFCPWCGRPLFPHPGPRPEPPPPPAPGTPEWFEAVERAQAEILEMWNRLDRELFGKRVGVGNPLDISGAISNRLPAGEAEAVLVQDPDLKCEVCGHELKHHSSLGGRYQGSCFKSTDSFRRCNCPRFVPDQGPALYVVDDNTVPPRMTMVKGADGSISFVAGEPPETP
jgi:hypothetical protein